MSRCVVSLATGRYIPGMNRLQKSLNGTPFMGWRDTMPPGSPSHLDVPYAFKGFALAAAANAGHTTLLWADACILPIADLEPLWEKIEAEGCWISKNGYRNSEWTCNEAYPLLGVTREQNHEIEHVVATTFGLSLMHPVGRAIFDEYFHLAQNGAFRGPWKGGIGIQHRHDQTGLSVAAWRAGVELTNPPAWFAYRDKDKAPHPSTVLLADSNY